MYGYFGVRRKEETNDLEIITLEEMNHRLVAEQRKQADKQLKSYGVLERRTPDFGYDD